jgi:hypothetical protein
MSQERERTEEGYGAPAIEEPKMDAGADSRIGEEAAQDTPGLYFGPWPGPGNSDGGGFD